MPDKTYRVHVHDQNDQGAWLTAADFTRRRPGREDITARIPVLNTPGRYEVRVNRVVDCDEYHVNGWRQSGPAAAPEPTADLIATVLRDRWPGATLSVGGHPERRYCVRLAAAQYDQAGDAHQLAAWLGRQLGHQFGCDGVTWVDHQGGGKDAVAHLYVRAAR
jgi:hypothetical protein